jgi:hypothetical protein
VLASCASGHSQPAYSSLTEDQKLEDFRYLFSTLNDECPGLPIKGCVEGFDWVSHEHEFEATVRQAKDDYEFARVVRSILIYAGLGHTSILNWDSAEGFSDKARIHLDTRAKSSESAANYWYGLANRGEPNPKWVPFIAVYVAGEYVVTDVAPDPVPKAMVEPGMIVVAVNRTPVHEFVMSHRGERALQYDPVRKRVFEQRLFFPNEAPFSILFRIPDGSLVEHEFTWASNSETVGSRQLPRYQAVEPWVRSTEVFIATLDVDGTKVGYVHLPTMNKDPSSDRDTLRTFFSGISDLPALILDIRGNGGGLPQYWTSAVVSLLAQSPLSYYYFRAVTPHTAQRLDMSPGLSEERLAETVRNLSGNEVSPLLDLCELDGFYMESISVDGSESIGFSGRIYLLVDDRVYSASEFFARFCKYTGFAEIVGGRTGGECPGAHALMVLPNSRMCVSFEPGLMIGPDGSTGIESHTVPDVFIEPDWEDYLAYVSLIRDAGFINKPNPDCDTVLRRCLELIANRTSP